MAISFEAFYWAIATQESGGNYGAVGVQTKYGRAYGKYQILDSNIGPWSKKYIGRAVSVQEFLNSPNIQEQVARGRMYDYWKQFGGNARKVAAAWYAGPGNAHLHMSTSSQYGGPSIKGYVDSVLNHASGYTGQSVGGAAGQTYNIPAATVPELDKYEMAEKYGLTWATINANKEIKSLFNKAIKEGWDADLFTAKLKNTKWWKTTSDSNRKFFLLKTGDPATYKAKWKENQFALNALAVEVGLTSQVNSKGHSSSILKRAILYKMRDGWSDARVKAWFGSMVKLHGSGAGQMYGEAGETYDQIFALAYANGVKHSRHWYQENVQDVMAGKKTLEHLEASVRQSAASKYYAFANQIRAGQNALDLAQPYVQAVAQILELPITDIDLLNPHVNRAMTAKVPPGQKPGTQYALWQFENDLRSDPLWRKTNNARESMFSVAHQVAVDFGFAF